MASAFDPSSQVFASAEQFDEWFDLDVDDCDAKRRMILQLHKLLRPFVLRRLKADVEKTLLPKTETILFTGLSAKQKETYKGLLKRDASLFQQGDGRPGGAPGENASRKAISNIAMQLRKCCNHPYLFQGVGSRRVHRFCARSLTSSLKGGRPSLSLSLSLSALALGLAFSTEELPSARFRKCNVSGFRPRGCVLVRIFSPGAIYS